MVLAQQVLARQVLHAEFTRRVTPHHRPEMVERLIQEHLRAPERRYRLADRQP